MDRAAPDFDFDGDFDFEGQKMILNRVEGAEADPGSENRRGMHRTLGSRPRDDGFRMPGEFEPHAGCWMLWPERSSTWRLAARPAQAAFAAVARAIARFEPVTVGAGKALLDNAHRMLPERVRVVELPSDDAWMRDVGPTFVVNRDTGAVRGIDWQFNAWGGRLGGAYHNWDRDDRVAGRVLEMEGVDRYRAPFILEGGSIHVDGQGTLITTEECLLNPNRNPQLSKTQIEDLLEVFLGVEKVIWLPKGVAEDETDGHVDNLCCFVKPAEVLLTWTEDRDDPQYEISRAACEVLSKATDAAGRPFTVHKLQQPGPLFMTEEECSGLDRRRDPLPRRAGDRLAGSYINFYIANGAVVMPLFADPHDEEARRMLESLFPQRQVVGVPGREILLGGGNIHCITQQVPAAAGL